jgi:uncharacterized protein YeaO (DUF488 family)
MSPAGKPRPPVIAIRRAYDEPASADGYRVLVDRYWPRGRSKADLCLDAWERGIAPTEELIRWFGHKPERWQEFRKRYLDELAVPQMQARLQALLAAAGGSRKITLVYGARNVEENQAVVLREALSATANG